MLEPGQRIMLLGLGADPVSRVGIFQPMPNTPTTTITTPISFWDSIPTWLKALGVLGLVYGGYKLYTRKK